MICNKWTKALSLFAFMSCLGVDCEMRCEHFVKYECMKVLVPLLLVAERLRRHRHDSGCRKVVRLL
jgi:hypothetical protein